MIGEGKGGGSRGVEEECRNFKETMLWVGEEVCETRRISEEKRRMESEWWNEKIRRVVGGKRECLLTWRRKMSEEI